MTWYTWGHWGDFQIDSGRELYVPAAILQGKLLFRDLWYMYGPLAPYVQAFLFRLFGIHLAVLYVFGFALTVASALLVFEIGRLLKLTMPACLVPPLFFLAEAFYPFIFNFIFPYSYAATLGSLLGLACLYFVLQHASSMRPLHLGIAAFLASLVILTKQEYGAACVALLAFEATASYAIRRSPRDLIRNLGVCLSGLTPALLVYGWFVWKVSARVLFIDNWVSTPGTYYMQRFGKYTTAYQGLRFEPAELLQSVEFTLLVMAIWTTIASLNVLVIKKLKLASLPAISLLLLSNLIPVWVVVHAGWAANTSLFPVTQMLFPKGSFFLALFFAALALWNLWKDPGPGANVQEAALGIYAVLVGFRVLMELWPTPYKYAVFFNVPVFLIFVILVDRSVRWAARSLEPKLRNFVAGCMLSVEAVLLFAVLLPNPASLSTPFTTGYGTFYTRPDVAALFPEIISFMKTHTRNRKDILVLPEPPSLYLFAGMQAPSRWYSLLPGVLPPGKEQEFIKEVSANQVRYVLIANRTMMEYGVARFGVGYNESIYQWIKGNFVQVGQFGPLLDKSAGRLPYTLFIYEKKNAVPAS